MAEGPPEPNMITNLATGVSVGLATLVWIAQRFFAKEERPQPSHVVLEQAEIADMRPLREVLPKLEKLLAMAEDVEELKETDRRILETLIRVDQAVERMDRAEEIERQVRDRLRAERPTRGGQD